MLNSRELLIYLEKRRKLKEFVKEFDNIFSGILFWLICHNLISLFTDFIVCFRFAESKVALFESLLVLGLSSFSLLGTVLFASRIPESFGEVKRKLRNLHQDALIETSPLTGNKLKYLALLKSFIDEEEFYFTAWGMINVDKSMILNTVGILITYGFLLATSS
ncbi:hypothetical protein TNIN_222161 [Trichonephila inaurata madagascariensis]|uniref:Uncharacterized protein n=1 Tax=Trichonephila inaurata madagascariensis TaxID=2747483 RepID=A0A8X6I848_9ARAC|nr:hypothetical protein TNIN_222161 [Trichonephila inaurata madagascariensis]